MNKGQLEGQEMPSNSKFRYLKSVMTRFRKTLEEIEKATNWLTEKAEKYDLDEKINSASS